MQSMASSISGQRVALAPRRAAARGRFVVQAGLPPSGSKLKAGQKVTVKESIKIWHAPSAAYTHFPKMKGLDLKGHTGTVFAIVDVHNGIPISATMPVKVEFTVTPTGGKPAKFTAHFVDEELEVVA